MKDVRRFFKKNWIFGIGVLLTFIPLPFYFILNWATIVGLWKHNLEVIWQTKYITLIAIQIVGYIIMSITHRDKTNGVL